MFSAKKNKTMRQLSKTESMLFLAGGALMVLGVALNFFGINKVSPWVFLVGAILFAVMQIRQTYTGQSITMKRLRSIMTIADVLFVVSGLLFVENNWGFLMPQFGRFGMDGWLFYVRYVAHNNWIVVLLIAAVLELYTVHRMSAEMAKHD